jgi:hypothetical protein
MESPEVAAAKRLEEYAIWLYAGAPLRQVLDEVVAYALKARARAEVRA